MTAVDLLTFGSVLAVRLLVELVGHYAENCKLNHMHLRSALSCCVCVAVCVPVSREVIRDGNDIAAVATILASGLGYYLGSVHYEKTRKSED